jgi:outer membrane biosynthesis protein TonB
MPLEITITSVTANTPVDIYVCELDGSNCAYISTVSTFPYTFTAPQCVEGNYFSSNFGFYDCQGLLNTGTSGGTGTICVDTSKPYSGITVGNVNCSVDQTDFIVEIRDTQTCIKTNVELVTPTPTASVTPTLTQTPTNTASQTPTLTPSPTNTPSVTTTITSSPTNTLTPTSTPFWVSHNFGSAWHSSSALALTDYLTSAPLWYTYIASSFLTPVIGATIFSLNIGDDLFNIINGENRWRLMSFNSETWAVQINSSGQIINFVYNPIQSPTPTVTQGLTPTPTETSTSVPTATPTNTPTNTQTPTNTTSQTQTPTNTVSQTETPTNTASQTATPTNTPTVTPTPTKTRFTFIGYSGSTQDQACGQYNSATIYGDNNIFDENVQFYNNLTGPVDVDMIGFYQYNGVVVQLLSGGSAPSTFNLCVTLTPTPTISPSQTPTITPTLTTSPSQTPTVTQTSTVTQTPTVTPSISLTPTQSPSPTQSIGYYVYILGSGSTPTMACSDYGSTPSTLYAPISGGVGPNVGEYLYTISGTPPTNPAPNGYYSNGVGWYLISGGNGQITSADPNGCD